MAVGLNAVREIVIRHPKALAVNPDLVDDLVEYKKHRNRGVVTAARSVIQALKELNPQLLRAKYRGKPSEHMTEVLKGAQSIIPGAEILNKYDLESENDSDEEAESSQMQNLKEDEDPEDSEDVEDDEEQDQEESDDEDPEQEETEDLEEESGSKDNDVANRTQSSSTSDVPAKQKSTSAQELLTSRILTDEDFKKIKLENMRKKIEFSSKAKKRKLAATKLNDGSNRKKKKVEKEVSDEEEWLNSDDLENESSGDEAELPRYESIARVNIKKRHDKEAKMASILAGRECREKFGRPKGRQNLHASTTNTEKSKKKNFVMMRQKNKRNQKRSFKERQLRLKNSLKKKYRK